MKNGISYKQNKIEGVFDYILIGSGPGSLACASVLSKYGKRCCVLEKHYTAGGFTHVFRRRGYEWDVGVHYIGDVNRPTTLLFKIFNYITEGRLKWEDMGEIYDKVILGDEEFHFVKGSENFKKEIKKNFSDPEDQKAIDKYIDLIYRANNASKGFYYEKVLPNFITYFLGNKLRKEYMKFASRTTLEVLQDLTNNKKLIALLTAQYGDYGLPPSKSSFAMHAMVAKHYMKGGSYPIGGAGQICASMLPTIRKGGGEVYTRAGVEQILFKNNRAIGVKMEDEKEFFAPVIISGVGYFNTYKMIPNWISKKIKWKKNNLKMKRSLSHMSLYIGLKGTTKDLGLKRANYWIYPDDYDHDLSMSKFLDNPEKESFALTYISFPSAKDPTWQERYPEKSTIEVITFAPYEWFNKWEQKEWKKRGEEYDNLKEKYSQRLLQQLYRVEPQLEGKIDHYELSTPLSTSHFVNYEKGEIYGLSHDPTRFKNKFLKPRTNLKNLFLTGQDIATAGVSGALVGGILTASTILNRNVIKEIVSK